MWSDCDTLQLCWYSCSHHPEDGHMSDRNMLMITVSQNYTHTSKCACWIFKNCIEYYVGGLYTMLVTTLKDSKTSKHVSILYQL